MLNFSDHPNAQKVFHFFTEISKIPHASENTGPIADYLVDFAEQRGLWSYRDEANNVIIRKPATAGKESSPTVIFQGHTDMVADKTADCTLDMSKDGLKLYRDGDFLRAEGTTLGGDDGVAIAYALALLDSNDIPHPEFEALFTSDEEIGLIGATALDASVLKGKLMVNIDSDEEGIFTVGCAGGMRIDTLHKGDSNCVSGEVYSLSVSGLKGGHSGVEIDKGRTNGIKLLSGLLSKLVAERVGEISGGNADNAIPRYAKACFTSALSFDVMQDKIKKALSELKLTEEDARIELSAVDSAMLFDAKLTKRLLAMINALPSGVVKMSEEISGLVETSANIGIVTCDEASVSVSLSIRSSKNSEKEALRRSINITAESLGAFVSERGAYPAWEYKKDSVLRDVMKDAYKDMYGKEPEIITIHAGLECGIFSDKIEGLDCVSIGPDNRDIHTPDERLSVSSTARVWDYLKEVLRRI